MAPRGHHGSTSNHRGRQPNQHGHENYQPGQRSSSQGGTSYIRSPSNRRWLPVRGSPSSSDSSGGGAPLSQGGPSPPASVVSGNSGSGTVGSNSMSHQSWDSQATHGNDIFHVGQPNPLMRDNPSVNAPDPSTLPVPSFLQRGGNQASGSGSGSASAPVPQAYPPAPAAAGPAYYQQPAQSYQAAPLPQQPQAPYPAQYNNYQSQYPQQGGGGAASYYAGIYGNQPAPVQALPMAPAPIWTAQHEMRYGQYIAQGYSHEQAEQWALENTQ